MHAQSVAGPGPGMMMGPRKQDIENPRMMASIDESDQQDLIINDPRRGSAGRAGSNLGSLAFESQGDASHKFSYAPDNARFSYGPKHGGLAKGAVGYGEEMSLSIRRGTYNGHVGSMAFESEHSKKLSVYSSGIDKNLQGFGSYRDNQIQLGMSERDRKKEILRKETLKNRNRQALDDLESDATACFSCFDCNQNNVKKQETNSAWQEVTYYKMDEIFKQNNPDQVPEWFEGFQ